MNEAERPRREKLLLLLRSGTVGIVATLADLLSLWLLVAWVGLRPEVANVPALLLGLCVQFLGNKYLAFGERSRAFLRQGLRFALVEVGALVLNAAIFHLLVTLSSIPYLAVRVVGSGSVYFLYSFPLWSWVFRAESRASQAGVES